VRLYIYGVLDEAGLPYLPDSFNQIVLSDESLTSGIPELPASVIVITRVIAQLSDDVLEAAAEVIEDPDPYTRMSIMASLDDMVFMAWDESDEMYRHLQWFNARGIPVYDMEDDFKELEIGKPEVDVEAIIESVTERVLRTVRAEIAELTTRRRSRSTAKKV
jgi:hypothetical protein